MNLTQTALAELLHVTKGTVYRWERGLWPMPEDKAELLEFKYAIWLDRNDDPFKV